MKNLVIIDNREKTTTEITNEFGLCYGASLAINGQLILEKQIEFLIKKFFAKVVLKVCFYLFI